MGVLLDVISFTQASDRICRNEPLNKRVGYWKEYIKGGQTMSAPGILDWSFPTATLKSYLVII